MHRLSEVQPCPMPTYANQKEKIGKAKYWVRYYIYKVLP